MTEPTYNENTGKRVVYDPKENWDDSGYLRIKYLYSHFPQDLKILSIMIFERKKLVVEKGKKQWQSDRIIPSPLIHHAIVYTEG